MTEIIYSGLKIIIRKPYKRYVWEVRLMDGFLLKKQMGGGFYTEGDAVDAAEEFIDNFLEVDEDSNIADDRKAV